MTSATDRARLIGFVAANGVRRVASRITNTFAAGLPFDGRAPARLLIAPHDLRTADPTIATDIYRGRFSLSGTAAEIGSTSPFDLIPPSPGWEVELLGFSWLRHLHAADDPVSRVHARALIADWISVHGRGHPVAWQPPVLARRIISWLAHSPLYLSQAEPDFYRLVMRSLGRQLRYLARHVHAAPDGVPRLTAHMALAYATLCISGLERLQLRATRLLATELDRQVLPDGGHFSRHPGAILDLLLDLLPLRQTFLSRDVAPPQSLISAIDRMMPMVRFFRHVDGSFALFNGMGRTPTGAVSAVLAYDDSRGATPDQAPHSGYQRLEAGPTVLLIDAGKPPPTSVSHAAHAGTLSIEVSSGKNRIITNCGTSITLKDDWRQAARATAAHSTVVIGGTSSARYLSGGVLGDLFGTPIIAGPRDVVAARHDTGDELVVETRHDGYRRLGLIHHRRIVLARDGMAVEGQDRLTRSSTVFSRTRTFAIRFHLHPGVRVTVSQDSRSALLALPTRENWRLSVSGASLRPEESVYLADPKGARRTEQLVVSGQCGNETLIRWALRREGVERVPRVRQVREGEREEQVLPLTVDPEGLDRDDADTASDDRPPAPEAQDSAPAPDADETAIAAPPVPHAEPGATETPEADQTQEAAPPQRPDSEPEPRTDPRPPASGPDGPGARDSQDRPFRSLATPTAIPGQGERREPSFGPSSSPPSPETGDDRVEPDIGGVAAPGGEGEDPSDDEPPRAGESGPDDGEDTRS